MKNINFFPYNFVKSSNGFSLIELLVAISVLGILASIAVPRFMEAISVAAEKTCQSNRAIVDRQEVIHLSRFGSASQDEAVPGDGLVSTGLLAAAPRCPEGGEYSWKTIANGNRVFSCSKHGTGSPESPVVFGSEFNSLSGMKVLTGSDWSLSGGLLTSTGTGERRIGFGDTSWTDYTYEATATLMNGTGYSLYYRTNLVAGSNNPGLSGYSLQYDPGMGNRIVVRIVTNGNESAPIWSVPMPTAIVSTLNQSHTMAITVSGNQHTVSIDGIVAGSFTDSQYSSGATGLRTWGTSQVSFDSVSVARDP